MRLSQNGVMPTVWLASRSVTTNRSAILPEIKGVLREEYQHIHSQVLQDVLLRLDRAFKAFFRRVANGEKARLPALSGSQPLQFRLPIRKEAIASQRSMSPSQKSARIKIKLHRTIEGTIKTCSIKYEAGQWYAVFSCECEASEPMSISSQEEVGIDLGLLHFAALSDGTFIDNPRFFRKAEKTLARRSTDEG